MYASAARFRSCDVEYVYLANSAASGNKTRQDAKSLSNTSYIMTLTDGAIGLQICLMSFLCLSTISADTIAVKTVKKEKICKLNVDIICGRPSALSSKFS